MHEIIVGSDFKHFKVLATLGQGSAADVFRIRDTDREYALKVYSGATNSDAAARFKREAALLMRINHPNVVRCLSTGAVNRRPYMVLELLKGENLKAFFANVTASYGSFPVRLATKIIRDIASALAAVLSATNHVHRDLKLENIMILRYGRIPKLIDFGLARNLATRTKLPRSWEFNAAPRYRAPEKWRDFHLADEQSDMWSLGIIYYYLLTGGFPYSTGHRKGSENKLMTHILQDDFIPPIHINPRVTWIHDSIVKMMLSKSPSIRPTFHELSMILTSPINKVEPTVNRIYTSRLQTKTVRRYSGGNEHLLELEDQQRRDRLCRMIHVARVKSCERLMQCEHKWGPKLSSPERRVANVCEVLLGFYDLANHRSYFRQALHDALNWLLLQQRDDGFPSLSYNWVTTQCTALSLLALCFVKDSSQGPARNDILSAINRGIGACWMLAGDRGWGTWKGGGIRIQPSLWVLIALARAQNRLDKQLLEKFDQIRAMHTAGQPGCYGFQPGTEAQASPTATFLVLCSELEKRGFIASDAKRLYLEKYNGIKLLCRSWQTHKRWDSEFETFQVDPHMRTLIGNVEHLSWSHISSPIIIKAFTSIQAFSGIWDGTNYWLAEAISLCGKLKKSGLLLDPLLSGAGMKDALFPTAYASWALRSAQSWLQSYGRASKLPPRTPDEDLGRKLIEKCAAAVITGEKLLLVRKFGTNKLIMPGGGIEKGESAIQTLKREMLEELGTRIAIVQNTPIGVYRAPAAFEKDTEVQITLYACNLNTDPTPQHEIEELVWYDVTCGKESALSPIVRDQIIPDLKRRKLLGNRKKPPSE